MESKSKTAKLIFCLWAIPSLLFICMAINLFFYPASQIKFNGQNAIPYISGAALFLGLVNGCVAVASYYAHKASLIISIISALISSVVLADYLTDSNGVNTKYLILPAYFLSISFITILFYCKRTSLKKA